MKKKNKLTTMYVLDYDDFEPGMSIGFYDGPYNTLKEAEEALLDTDIFEDLHIIEIKYRPVAKLGGSKIVKL